MFPARGGTGWTPSRGALATPPSAGGRSGAGLRRQLPGGRRAGEGRAPAAVFQQREWVGAIENKPARGTRRGGEARRGPREPAVPFSPVPEERESTGLHRAEAAGEGAGGGGGPGCGPGSGGERRGRGGSRGEGGRAGRLFTALECGVRARLTPPPGCLGPGQRERRRGERGSCPPPLPGRMLAGQRGAVRWERARAEGSSGSSSCVGTPRHLPVVPNFPPSPPPLPPPHPE